MSCVEQPRDRVEFIPGKDFVEEHAFEQSSYRSSLSSSPQSTTTPFYIETGIKMDQFDDNVLSAPHSKGDGLSVPAPPAKSALRASRLLETLPQKLAAEDQPVLTPAAPHIMYLSDEDASSSADDFSDCDYSSDDESEEDWQHKTSIEDTARIVSVIFSGKPSIIELHRRLVLPGSTQHPVLELLRTSTEPSLSTRGGSASPVSSHASQYPPRTSSMIATTSLDQPRHQFLNVEPFATAEGETEEPDGQVPRKTATMLKRTLSLVRKRSKPILNPAMAQSRETLFLQTTPTQQLGEEEQVAKHVTKPRSATPRPMSSYGEIMSSVRRISYSAATSPVCETASPLTPTQRIRSGFLARRRSVKI